MKLLRLIKFCIPLIVLMFSFTVAGAQSFERPPEHKLVKGVSKKPPGRKKQVRIHEPRSVSKAKREQQTAEKKREKDYSKQLKEDRKRHMEIQTPEVRERILQNRKESDTKYKTKKKAVASKNKKAGKKYK